MGRRKKHAPKRGSLAYLPKARAERWVGRIRFWPEFDGKSTLLAFAGYKSGMTYVVALDNRPGSINYGKEVVFPVTIVETPPMVTCALRAYVKTGEGLKTLTEAWMENPPKDFGRMLALPEKFNTGDSLKKIEDSIDRVAEIRVVLAAQPRLAKFGMKTPQLLEVKVGGGDVKEQYEYAKSILGRSIAVSEVLKEGQWVDVVSITKGKGIQGPVKRWGVSILHHKSRKTMRGVGATGPWTPHFVPYSVPRAGQMGFFQRTQYNKQMLKVGSSGAEVTPKGGFKHYGTVKNDYVLLEGHVAGPTKRLLTMRYGVRAAGLPTAAPKIESISLG